LRDGCINRPTIELHIIQLNFNFNIHPTPKEKTVVDNYNTIILTLMLNGATTVEIEISVKV